MSNSIFNIIVFNREKQKVKKAVLYAFALVIPVLFMASCLKNPTAPTVVTTGSISGIVQIKPWICGPCNPLPGGGPIVFVTSTPGGPTPAPMDTPVPAPTETPVSYSGVVVTAYLNGVQKASAVTDTNGNYRLANLAPGFYDLQILIPQYDVDNSMKNITVTAGTDTAGHDLIEIRFWVPGKLEISFKNTVTAAQARQILADYGCTIDTAFETNPDFLFYFVTIPADKTPPQMEVIMKSAPGVDIPFREQYGCACPA